MSTAPSSESEPPPSCTKAAVENASPARDLPAGSQGRCSVRASLVGGKSRAVLHLFQGSAFHGFFFLTTLQSRSPALLLAAFERLWNKADPKGICLPDPEFR